MYWGIAVQHGNHVMYWGIVVQHSNHVMYWGIAVQHSNHVISGYSCTAWQSCHDWGIAAQHGNHVLYWGIIHFLYTFERLFFVYIVNSLPALFARSNYPTLL